MSGRAAAAARPDRRQGAVRLNPLGMRPGALLAVPVIAGLLFLVLPLVFLTIRAFSGDGLNGFGDVLSGPLFVGAVKRTLALSLVVSLLCAVVGTVYALAIAASPRVVAYALLAALLSAFWLSILVRTFGWVLLFQPNGALDQFVQKLGVTHNSLDLLQTTTAMYPAMVHVMLPFLVLPVYAACQRIDPDLLRASQSLGARPLSVIRHVVIPQLRPAILAGTSLVFMLSLAFFITPLLIGGPRQLTVATMIDREFNVVYDLAAAARMALILLAVVVAIFVVIDRFVELIPTGTED